MPQPTDYKCNPPLAAQVSPTRAAIGLKVENRLARTPGVQRMPIEQASIFGLPNFLSRNECRRLAEAIDEGCRRSPEFRYGTAPSRRTSSTFTFRPDQAEAMEVGDRIAQLLGLPPAFGEAMQGQRYLPGEHFLIHPDFFLIDRPYWADVEPRGGQRTWTAMVYLNEPEEGGATRFPYPEIEIRPTRGFLLAWNNMKPDGSPNMWTSHEGTAVTAGSKYILTKWFRERSPTPAPAS